MIWGYAMSEVNITYETLYEFMRNEKNRDDIQQLPATFHTDASAYLNKIKKIVTNTSGTPHEEEREDRARQLRNVKNLITEIYNRRETKILHLALNASRTKSESIELDALLPSEKALYSEILKILDRNRNNILNATLDCTTPTTVDDFASKQQETHQHSQTENTKSDIPKPKQTTSERKTDPLTQAKSEEKANTQQEKAQPEEKSVSSTAHEKPSPQNSESNNDQSSHGQTTKNVKFTEIVPKFLGKELEVYGPYQPEDTATLPSYLADILITKGKAKEEI
ncbi:MAG: hypothetical protein ACMXYE_02795 [Candidatus Woesearchaeota archaeon]